MAKKATSSGAQLIKPLTREQLGAPDALARIFSKEQLRRAFRRIVKRDKDDLVTHPLKRPLLIAFEDGDHRPQPTTLAAGSVGGVQNAALNARSNQRQTRRESMRGGCARRIDPPTAMALHVLLPRFDLIQPVQHAQNSSRLTSDRRKK